MASDSPSFPSSYHNNKKIESSSSASIKDVLSNVKFLRFLFFNFLFIGSSFIPIVFMVNYGARWLAGCDPNSLDDCKDINYAQLNFYQSVSLSVKGAISFLFVGWQGRLSDAYGRKLFLILHPILYSLQYFPLLLANNFLWYLVLSPISGLIGASLGLSPMMSAYISDVLPSDQRTLGYSVSYGIAGIALLVSGLISLIVALYMSDDINFALILLLYAFQTIYIWFFIDESLDFDHSKPLSQSKLINPLRPLLQITNNRTVFWICWCQFLISFMEVGLLNICMVYILTQLKIAGNASSDVVTFVFLISVSFGLFSSTACIIPLSRNYNFDCFWAKKHRPNYQRLSIVEPSQISSTTLMTPTPMSITTNQKPRLLPFQITKDQNMKMPIKIWKDFNNLLIGTLLSFISLFAIGCVHWIHNLLYIAICGCLVGSAVGITFPSANGLVSLSLRNDEQGKGFGLIYAVKGITSCLAPFAFGTFYTYLDMRGCGPLIFLFGMLLTFAAILIIIFPLRWVLCDQQGHKRNNSLLFAKHNVVTYT